MGHRENFDEDYTFEVRVSSRGGWSVSLPHQCDDWEIVGADYDERDYDESALFVENDGGYPALPKDKDFAIKQMKIFVQRAQEALEKLISMTENKNIK